MNKISGPASQVDFFYDAEPRFRGASDFAAGIGGLAIPNVKALGHRFRLLQQDPGAARAESQRISAEPAAIPERINRAPNFLPAVFLELGALRARPVCKIETEGRGYDGVAGNWTGTGFLVCDDILVTNHHVINSVETAQNAVCIFNFQLAHDGKPAETLAVRLDPARLFVTSPLQGGLDYTFIAIDSVAARQFGCIPMVRSAFTIHPGDNANIVQHADGRRKEVVLHENEVIQDTGVLLHYASDTLGGSSGGPVFNNRWQLIALHHAAKDNVNAITASPELLPPAFLNEGIKISAIATDLERRAQIPGEATAARAVLRAFQGVDSLLGFFGALGRAPSAPDGTGVERVVDAYSGEGDDIDIAFWNIEWFANRWQEKLDLVAQTVADLNLDIWALSESSPAAAKALVERLKRDYDLEFDCAFSEPLAPEGRQSTTLVWNTRAVKGERLDWPEEIDGWFHVQSQQFDDLRLEAVHGKVFDRYPGLFRFEAINRPPTAAPVDFLLVPLHLKALSEGSTRRRMAAKILAAAVNKMIAAGTDGDWIIGGDYNAELATGDFRELTRGKLVPLSAQDEQHGAMTYLKSPRSLIDHIFLSHNLARTFGADDFFIVAADRQFPDYLPKLSDHRPVLVRLSLANQPAAAEQLPESLASALRLV